MNFTNLDQALSLAAVTQVEKNRARWFRLHPKITEERRSLTNEYWDQMASKALAQSLADAVCAAYLEIE